MIGNVNEEAYAKMRDKIVAGMFKPNSGLERLRLRAWVQLDLFPNYTERAMSEKIFDELINPASTRGKRNRRRGKEVENEVVNLLRDAGIPAERISRVGYTGPDIQVSDTYLGEVKLRREGFKLLRRWMSGAHLLFLRSQGDRIPVVVMDWQTFLELLRR